MAGTPAQLTDDALTFLTERHLATLSSVRPDGSPHVVPVGFTWDAPAGLARIITNRSSVKARLVAAGGPVAVCQVDGGRWLTLEGTGLVSDDPDRVAEAVRRYGERYRVPAANPERVVLELTITRVLGSPAFLAVPASPTPPA